MNIDWLIDGPNLAFVLPLLLALVYLGLYVASGVTFGEPDVDADLDADLDGDGVPNADAHASPDHHVDVEHDLDADADVDADADAHHPIGATHVPSFQVLSWFGIGRVPVSLWLSGAMLGWGVFGIAAATAAHGRHLDGLTPLLCVFAVACVGALLTTRVLAWIVTSLVPIQETYARRRHALLGTVGVAVLPIDAAFGLVGIRDDRGEWFQVPCRADGASADSTIAKGSRVKLVGYSRDTKLFHVVPTDAAATAREPG